MGTTRNVTLALPVGLIRRAEALAAARDVSISALVAEVLAERIESNDDLDAAWNREFELMEAGL